MLPLLAPLLAGCVHPLACGPLTHEQDGQCVLDDGVGPLDDAPDSAGDSDSAPDSAPDSGESGGQVDTSETSDTAGPDVLDVYILAGQSNMDGYSVYTGLPPSWREADEDVQLYWSGWGEFRALAPASYGGAAYSGPEVALGHTLADAGRHVAFVKHAVGGTDLYSYWYPGETASEPGQGDGWTTLVASMRDASAALDASGVTWRWAGFVWMQGESDALDATMTAAYAEDLERLLRRVREESETPDLPATIGLIACEDLCPYLDEVRAAQLAVAAADPLVTTVETLDLPRNVYDSWHYDGPAGRQLGARFAQAILGESAEAPVLAALKVESYGVHYDGDFTVGWTFTLHEPVTLTDVGGFSTSGAVLYTSTEVGIWDNDTGELLVRESVPSWYEAPTTFRDGFWYTAIEPVTLEPGTYAVGLSAWAGDYDSYADSCVVTPGDGVQVSGAAYHSGQWLTFPEQQWTVDASAMSFLGPSFLYRAAE